VALRENVPSVQCEVLTGSGENINFMLLTERLHFLH